MKILIAHNRYQFAAGEETVVYAERALLQQKGNDVSLVEVSNDSINSGWSKLKATTSAIYSLSAKRLLSAEINRFQPDIVHVHNFFPLLSPSIYDACINAQIPVVQTLHNYRLTCPGAKLLRDGKICEDCLGKKVPWRGVLHGCYRDSQVQSAAVAVMVAVHQIRGTWQERVDAHITLTDFQRQKMIQAGLPESKVYVKPNFLFEPSLKGSKHSGNYALFVGRLWEEKGIVTLIDAYIQAGLTLPLKVIGDGPLQPILQRRVQSAGLEHVIEFVGWKEKSEVLVLMQNSQFLIFPSIWYETFGLSIIEAFACGIPVLASRLGCMAELVEDGVTGLHFEAGNAIDLATKIAWAQTHPTEVAKMGKTASKVYEARYTPETNYSQLMAIYDKVCEKYSVSC